MERETAMHRTSTAAAAPSPPDKSPVDTNDNAEKLLNDAAIAKITDLKRLPSVSSFTQCTTSSDVPNIKIRLLRIEQVFLSTCAFHKRQALQRL